MAVIEDWIRLIIHWRFDRLLLAFWLLPSLASAASSYEQWWNYDGFSGPEFWGLVNWEWKVCSKGQHQSPINIDPKLLLFDPQLKPLYVDKVRVTGYLENTGQFLTMLVDEKQSQYPVMISGGPLGMYQYKLHQIMLHFGAKDNIGSEHAIDGEKFAGEVQMFGFNTDLYGNFSEAAKMPHGVAGVSLVVEVSKTTSPELKQLATAAIDVSYKGRRAKVASFSAHYLLPPTGHYVTYDGSFTYPGCYETVTWTIMNKPIYISKSDLKLFREIHATEKKMEDPQFLTNNFRPLKPLNRRLLRTNINFKTTGTACPTMYKDMGYKANPNRKTNRFDSSNRLSTAAFFDRN